MSIECALDGALLKEMREEFGVSLTHIWRPVFRCGFLFMGSWCGKSSKTCFPTYRFYQNSQSWNVDAGSGFAFHLWKHVRWDQILHQHSSCVPYGTSCSLMFPAVSPPFFAVMLCVTCCMHDLRCYRVHWVMLKSCWWAPVQVLAGPLYSKYQIISLC